MRNQKRDFKIRALGRENAKNSFSIHATPGNSELAVQSSDVTGPNADSAANGKSIYWGKKRWLVKRCVVV